jgi:GTP-binding protein
MQVKVASPAWSVHENPSVMKIHSAAFAASAPNLKSCPPGGLPEFAFIGRSNVGKSSLINLLTGKKDLARVSGMPGKTQLLNFFTINGGWRLVDLPGYGYAHTAKAKRADFNEAVADYLEQRGDLRHTFVLIDSRLPPQAIDREFIGWLMETGAEFSLVFTKTDKQSAAQTRNGIERFRAEVLAGTAPAPAIFAVSAKSRIGRGEILAHIAGMLA